MTAGRDRACRSQYSYSTISYSATHSILLNHRYDQTKELDNCLIVGYNYTNVYQINYHKLEIIQNLFNIFIKLLKMLIFICDNIFKKKLI